MDIRSGKMISLGYGKYWRSDNIVGLMRIEEERGPGRRTDVFTANLSEPITASRTEKAILADMAIASGFSFEAEQIREMMADLGATLSDIPDVLKRTLEREAGFDVDAWRKRVSALLKVEGGQEDDPQNDLFGD